jgi:hypothetical protein
LRNFRGIAASLSFAIGRLNCAAWCVLKNLLKNRSLLYYQIFNIPWQCPDVDEDIACRIVIFQNFLIVLLGSTDNLTGMLNCQWLQLEYGLHPNKEFQALKDFWLEKLKTSSESLYREVRRVL